MEDTNLNREPFYWLNEDSITFLERGYLSEGEDAKERVRDIADNAERILGIDGFSDKFYDYMSKGYYSLSSPVWSNFGKDRGLPISCYSVDIQDDMGDIMRSVGEVGIMSKLGGGTGGYFGKLRPRGSKITDNGESFGSVHFMELYDKLMNVASQGCYDDKTEVLTENGFELLKDVVERKDGTLIAQVTDDDKIEFVEPEDYMEFIPEDNELIRFKDSKNIDLLVTKNHNMVFKYESKKVNKETGKKEYVLRPEYRVRRADDMPLHRDVKMVHSSFAKDGEGLTMKERLLIALQADGYITINNKNLIRFRFKKERKAKRIEWILNSLNLKYSFSYYDSDDTYNYYVNVGEELPKTFEEWVDLTDVSLEWANDFIEETKHWDGSYENEFAYSYSSIIESNVDILQSVASMCGYKTYKNVDYREEYPNKSTIYNLYLSRGQMFGVSGVKPELVEYNGKVYCVEVPSHKLIVRRNGRVVVCGNSVRRGAFSPYLPIEHGDIDEFLKIGTEGHPIQGLNHAVTVTDKWLQEMIDGDIDKRETWAKVIQARGELGFPYIFFHDNVNNNNADVYKDKNLTVNHSNLCVAPYTKILTDGGYKEIGKLKDQKVNVWNGEEWSEVTVKQTGENQEMLKVKTNSGFELDSTPYHKYYVLEETESGKRTKPPRYKEVRAKDLKVGAKLIKFDLPIIEGQKELDFAYDNGFFTGDGTVNGKNKVIYLYGEKQKLAKHFKSIDKWSESKEQDRYVGLTKKLEDKYFVPMNEYTINSRLKWLSGFLDADGTVTNNNGSQSIQAGSTNKEFLKDVQLMLQTLGVDSKVTLGKKEGTSMMPANDGTGEYKEFKTKELYRILINGNSLYKLDQLGLECNRLTWETKEPNRECSQFIKVTGIEEIEETMDTFCFTEPKRHMGMFNGILTGQCSEITLPTNEDWSFVCCLSSINLLHYDEWKDTDAVETLIYFLDAVMSEFITKLEEMRDSGERDKQEIFNFMEKAYRFAKEHRALGMGTIGQHSYYQSKMIPFESMEATKLNARIYKNIQRKALKASQELAEMFGEPELLKGYGRRNSVMTAIAPTTSSAFILGQVSQSIEPYFSNSYVKDLAKTKVTIRNPHLTKLLQEKGKDTREVWSSIRMHDGSVQHLDFLTQHEKDVFKTFGEINQYVIIDQAAVRQQFIDQAQSLNVMVNPSMSAKEINELYIFAWKNGIKTLYYQHSTSAAQEFNRNALCIACEA